MITDLRWIRTENTYPYRNLAIEEYLTMNTAPGQCILYLWQNRDTVVIGRNQNAWKECKVNELEEGGGFLVRRLSGGGAVYHDDDNLNFTFCVQQDDYDVDRQLQVILTALASLGVRAEKTGRNDITVEGRKISGNAFYHEGIHCYHHGTLLIHVDPDKMSRYLNVDKKKLASKGVDSVRARVGAITDIDPSVTVERMAEALVQAFSEVYGLPASELSEDALPEEALAAATEKFASWEFRFGRRIPFDYEIDERFDWGGISLQFHVEEGIIRDIAVYSDALDDRLASGLENVLAGRRYDAAELASAVADLHLSADIISEEILEQAKKDITDLIRERI